MDLNKHIFKNDDNKPFHSNGYAQVSRGDQIGAASNTSFNQRQQIDHNRQLVDNYKYSTLGRSSNDYFRAKSVKPSDSTTNNSFNKRVHPRQRDGSNIRPARFSEPSSKTYNPYS